MNKQRSTETRARIMHSALANFSANGKKSGRMTAIAYHAGLSTSALYYYYNSSENLYRLVFQSSLKKVVTSIYDRLLHLKLKSGKNTPENIINQFWEDNPEIVSLFIYEILDGGEELRHLFTSKSRQNQEILKKLAEVFTLIPGNSSSELTESTVIKNATRFLTLSMSRHLVKNVLSNIFRTI